MLVNCPRCNTTYDMKSAIPSGSRATVTCLVCQTQLEVEPRGAAYLYRPKITIRQPNQEVINIVLDSQEIPGVDDGSMGKSE